ncbi:helix-turn-helix domain-containing protein [Pseudomonas sp.]|uniref:helix-turn-helix transcriptional regulator n=1 Tax=Pseudomonas sp. TaxID=306 RepID=UPI00258AC487|nr:helix-turn-helix domain-containing protein [Pseudomonas sp.]
MKVTINGRDFIPAPEGSGLPIWTLFYQARTRLGMTQSHVTQVTGISTCTVGQCETEGYTPTLRTAIKLARIYGLSADDIMRGVPGC